MIHVRVKGGGGFNTDSPSQPQPTPQPQQPPQPPQPPLAFQPQPQPQLAPHPQMPPSPLSVQTPPRPTVQQAAAAALAQPQQYGAPPQPQLPSPHAYAQPTQPQPQPQLPSPHAYTQQPQTSPQIRRAVSLNVYPADPQHAARVSPQARPPQPQQPPQQQQARTQHYTPPRKPNIFARRGSVSQGAPAYTSPQLPRAPPAAGPAWPQQHAAQHVQGGAYAPPPAAMVQPDTYIPTSSAQGFGTMPIKRVSRRHSIANFGGYEADALPQPLPQMPPQPYAAAPYGSPLPQPQQQQQPQQPQAPPQQYQPAPPMPAPSPPPQLLQQPASGLSVDERTAAAAAMGAEFAHLRQLSVVEQLTELQGEIAKLRRELREKDQLLLVWQSLLRGDGSPYTFIEACQEGRIPLMDFFLVHGADIFQAKDGKNGLMWAAERAQREAVEFLLQRGLEVDRIVEQDKGGLCETALIVAVQGGDPQTVEMLLKRGADPNRESPVTFMTPLIAAARAGRLEVVDLLLRNGASLNSYNPRARVGSALFQACAHGHIEVVKLLTSRGARFLSDNPPEYPIPAFSMSEIAVVCQLGPPNAIEIINHLVERGALVNAFCGPQARTALMFAAENNFPQLIARLVELGAVIDNVDAAGMSALMYAARGGHIDAAWTLLMAGADADFVSHGFGNSPLNLAVANREGPPAMIAMLVQFGANPNGPAGPDRPGKKALQGATEAQREAASRGVHYRATVAREIADVLSEAAETVAPPSVVKLVRAYLPGSELPARFVIDS